MKNQTLGALAAGAIALLPSCAEAQAPARQTEARKPFTSDRIAVTARGDGRDVVLIHGVNSSTAVWNATVKAVPGYRYHLVQIAGFGGTRPGGNAQGRVVAPVADEVARYIRHRGLGRPAIIGHSMGGAIAMMIASRHPGQVGKAMVIDILPAPAGVLGGTAASIAPLANILLGFAGTAEGQRLYERYAGPSNGSDRGVAARAYHDLATTDLTDDLAKVTTPLTVLYATPAAPDRAAAVQRSYTRGYASARSAKLVRVPDSGHMVMYDQPTAFNAAVRAFLR